MIFYGKFKGMPNNDKAIKLLGIYMYCLNQVKRKYIEQDHSGPFRYLIFFLIFYINGRYARLGL